MVKLASHPYNTRSKGKQKMAPRDGNESDNDEEIQNQMTSQETGTTEEIRVLRQQMAEMYELQSETILIQICLTLSRCRQAIRYIPLDSTPMLTHSMSLELQW